MNEDLAWGLSVLIWIAVVALGILSLVYFYDSIKKRLEQVTVMRGVFGPSPTPKNPTQEVDPQSRQDQPSLPAAPATSYRSMLLEGDKKDGQPE